MLGKSNQLDRLNINQYLSYCELPKRHFCVFKCVNHQVSLAGNDMPVGFLVGTWQSSELLTVLTSILTEEALGFHTIPHPVKAGNGASPIYALAGCTDFDNASDRGCHGYETKIHVSMDSWVGSYASARDKFNRQNPRIASVDLGGMGCLAVVSFRCFQCVGVEETSYSCYIAAQVPLYKDLQTTGL